MQIKVSRQKVKLNSDTGVTLKNQINELRSIEDILDVDEVEVVDGATMIYNATTGKYEVKLLNLGDVGSDIDGGEY